MGKPGMYIQSDIQFVQQVQDAIRELPHGEDPEDEHIIPYYINMNLFARFFSNDQPGKGNSIQASELHVAYSDYFAEMIEEEELMFEDLVRMNDDPEFEAVMDFEFDEDDPEWFTLGKQVPSTIHGYAFENMF